MTGASLRIGGGYWLDGPASGCRRFSIGGCRVAADRLAGGGEVHCVTGSCSGLGSRGCLVAIICHVHGVFTLDGACGPRRGEWRSLWSRRGDWSSPAFPGEGIVVAAAVGTVGGGGWAASRDWPVVAPLGGGGVLAPMRRTSMMKCAIWAGGVFLGASGRYVSVSVAVGALGIAVCLDDSFDLAAFGEEDDSLEEFVHLLGVNGENHRSRFFG